MMNTEEAKEYLGSGRTWLSTKAASGEIPSYKIKGRRWFKKEDLDRWIEAQRHERGD